MTPRVFAEYLPEISRRKFAEFLRKFSQSFFLGLICTRPCLEIEISLYVQKFCCC